MLIPETSDSDVSCDVSEQETVPYANCMNEGTSTKSDTHVKPHIDLSGLSEKTSQLEEPSQKHDVSDDGALELVREIFFT